MIRSSIRLIQLLRNKTRWSGENTRVVGRGTWYQRVLNSNPRLWANFHRLWQIIDIGIHMSHRRPSVHGSWEEIMILRNVHPSDCHNPKGKSVAVSNDQRGNNYEVWREFLTWFQIIKAHLYFHICMLTSTCVLLTFKHIPITLHCCVKWRKCYVLSSVVIYMMRHLSLTTSSNKTCLSIPETTTLEVSPIKYANVWVKSIHNVKKG